jgi:glycerol-3-phosphate dehydrogenase (NAD(P)+)
MATSHSFAVLGAGSWGTALALQLARTGHEVHIWGHLESEIDPLIVERENKFYLPGCPFPDNITATTNLGLAIANSRDILIVVPSHVLRIVLEQIKPMLRDKQKVNWATKGFELDSGLLPHQVVDEVLGRGHLGCVLSGPTFAKEVGAGMPSALTIASHDSKLAKRIAGQISNQQFRAYTSKDITGVEVGGAVKNVIAIAAGGCDGLGFGTNARVALITRGLTEVMRLGKKLGAKRRTFMGLAGMGDLVLTCSDDQSRNRRMGLALAAGQGIEAAKKEIQQVVEGVQAAKAVYQMAQKHNLDLPIVEQVYKVIYEDLAPQEAFENLMQRELGTE